MASLPDPSTFALSVAVGSAHVLRTVLDALDGAAVLLALPVLAAYLAAAALAFAVRVAGDVYAHTVACGPNVGDTAAALLSALLAWLANTAAKLVIDFLCPRGWSATLLHFSPVLLSCIGSRVVVCFCSWPKFTSGEVCNVIFQTDITNFDKLPLRLKPIERLGVNALVSGENQTVQHGS